MKIKQAWLKKAKSEEDKEKLKEQLLISRHTLEVLGEILKDRLEENYQQQRNKTNYESPSWPYLQADSVGAQRAYKEIIDLITFK